MKITLLCSDEQHPVNKHLIQWIEQNHELHQIAFVRKKNELPGGDVLFLISCSEIINIEDRAKYRTCLVLHASDLPRGRGWSPHIWQIVEGAEKVTLTLLEADDSVDSGRIWSKISFPLPKHALWNELNKRLFDAEIDLINFAVNNYEIVEPCAQNPEIDPTYYRRRTPEDSRVDPESSIASQFDNIRVCDPQRFPAFFELHGHRYKISLEKISE